MVHGNCWGQKFGRHEQGKKIKLIKTIRIQEANEIRKNKDAGRIKILGAYFSATGTTKGVAEMTTAAVPLR